VKRQGDIPLWLMPFGLRGAAGEEPVPALASKLYRESNLRLRPGCIAVGPETGRALGLRDGGRAVLQTAAGRLPVEVRFDPLVLPGIAHTPVGPLSDGAGEADAAGRLLATLCAAGEGPFRRIFPVRVLEA
jgi:hypothetical protein